MVNKSKRRSLESAGISDAQYIRIMEKVAEQNYKDWGLPNSDAALIQALNDNTYNYRGYYNKYPNGKGNAVDHWTDEFKTVYHPTFSDESIYSGKKSQYNPKGFKGGHWKGETFVPANWQRSKKSDGGISASTINRNEATYDANTDTFIPRYTLPKIVVKGKQKSILSKNKPYFVSSRVGQLTAGDALKGIDAAIGPLAHWIQLSQYVGAIRDGINGKNPLVSMLRGNSGVVSEKYAAEHPIISTTINAGTDLLGAVTGSSLTSAARNTAFNKHLPWKYSIPENENMAYRIISPLEKDWLLQGNELSTRATNVLTKAEEAAARSTQKGRFNLFKAGAEHGGRKQFSKGRPWQGTTTTHGEKQILVIPGKNLPWVSGRHYAGPQGYGFKVGKLSFEEAPVGSHIDLMTNQSGFSGVNPSQLDGSVIYSPFKIFGKPFGYRVRPVKRDGGSIHIVPSKRGTFTAAASKHGMGVQAFASRVLANKDNYYPAMVKKANFARNASKWNH